MKMVAFGWSVYLENPLSLCTGHVTPTGIFQQIISIPYQAMQILFDIRFSENISTMSTFQYIPIALIEVISGFVT